MKLFTFDSTGIALNQKAGDIEAADIDTDAVVETKILNDAVTTAKIVNGAVTEAKLVPASTNGLGALRVYRDTFDLTGAVGDTALTVELPAGAGLVRAKVAITTPLTDTATNISTVSIMSEATTDIMAATTIDGAPWSTGGVKDTKLDGTAAASVLISVAKAVTMEVTLLGGATSITAGAGTIWIEYYL